MDIYKEPVGNTCPQINYIQSCIKDAVKECKRDYDSFDLAKDGFSDVLYYIEDIPSDLEAIRTDNDELRKWGYALLDKVKELENEISELNNEISELNNENN